VSKLSFDTAVLSRSQSMFWEIKAKVHTFSVHIQTVLKQSLITFRTGNGRLRLKCDGTRAETSISSFGETEESI